LLESYDWPGNVRELQNVIERSLILSPPGTLELDLPRLETAREPLSSNGHTAESRLLTEIEFRQFEAKNLMTALSVSRWKIHGSGGAAELLGLKPTTLISRIKKLGLQKP
jgi:transcriptional regulator with GAF, ATPase, and Fis domain